MGLTCGVGGGLHVDLFPFPPSPTTAGCAVSWAPGGPSWAGWRSRWDSLSWARPGLGVHGTLLAFQEVRAAGAEPWSLDFCPRATRARVSAGSPGPAALREGPRAEAWSRSLSQAPLPVPGGSPPTPLHLSIDLDTNGPVHLPVEKSAQGGVALVPRVAPSPPLLGALGAAGSPRSGFLWRFLEERGGPRLAGPSVPTGLASGTGPGGRGQGPPSRRCWAHCDLQEQGSGLPGLGVGGPGLRAAGRPVPTRRDRDWRVPALLQQGAHGRCPVSGEGRSRPLCPSASGRREVGRGMTAAAAPPPGGCEGLVSGDSALGHTGLGWLQLQCS